MGRLTTSLVLCLSIAMSCDVVIASDFRHGIPEEHGMSSARLERMSAGPKTILVRNSDGR